MPFDDLNLEFEDEEEALKKKKAETLQVDVDLEFQAPDPSGKPRPVNRPVPPGATPVSRPDATRPGAEVRQINEARPAAPGTQSQIRRPGPPGVPPQAPAAPAAVARPMVAGANALETSYDLESEHIVQMREEMRRVQLESEVKVGIAEFKTEFLTEMLSDMKLLEHQIGQLLVRINAKHPDMKQEVLMIKKLLADFNAKKRK
jgi:hypothetical protein